MVANGGGFVGRLNENCDGYIFGLEVPADGLDCFGAFLDELAARGEAMVYRRLHKVVGQGHFLATLAEMELSGVPMAVFDISWLDSGWLRASRTMSTAALSRKSG